MKNKKITEIGDEELKLVSGGNMTEIRELIIAAQNRGITIPAGSGADEISRILTDMVTAVITENGYTADAVTLDLGNGAGGNSYHVQGGFLSHAQIMSMLGKKA